MPPTLPKRARYTKREQTSNPPQPRPRTHAFTGCLTCRERHVKCDLGQPTCKNCFRLKVVCEGYARKYSWMTPKIPGEKRKVSTTESIDESEEIQTSRRVLFTDEERKAMVVQMRNQCCLASSDLDLDRILKELQDKVPSNQDFSNIGPFGILQIAKESMETTLTRHINVTTPDSRVPTPELNLSLSQFSWGELNQDIQTWDSLEAESASALVDLRFTPDKDSPFNMNISPHWVNLHPVSAEDSSVEQDKSENVNDNTVVSNFEMNINSDESRQLTINADTFNQWNRRASILTMSNEENLSKIPSEARLLLDYYSSRIIDVMTMSPGQKPPWKTIHLPCAMSALAELIVHGETKSLAKMALFYALLSVSSFHIACTNKSSDERSEYWQERGKIHKTNAETYLRAALDTSLSKSARGKYKEVLMSALSMVTIGVFSGNMQDSHTYLAESESLIRTLGLPKPVKSQKVSKLHHIFSFLRIIHESTSLRRNGGISKHHDNHEYAADLTIRQGSEEASNDIAQSASSRLAWVEEDEGEDPEDSLFLSIYQLPTTLLSLLSQTSSLCKQLQSSVCTTAEFSRRCQIIEDRIFRWKAPETLSLSNYFGSNAFEVESPDVAAKEIAAHLVDATYQALIVHFQRQIRNTNPRVLQHYVVTAADHLLAHEQLKQSLNIATAPFPWPGFIVGCEAYDVAARQKIDTYLKLVRCYNVGSLAKAEKVVYEVWRRQDAGQADSHWEDVLRDWELQVVLT